MLAVPGRTWSYAFTNLPFGRKQSFKVFTDDGGIRLTKALQGRDRGVAAAVRVAL